MAQVRETTEIQAAPGQSPELEPELTATFGQIYGEGLATSASTGNASRARL